MTKAIAEFNFFDPEVLTNPFEFYEALREQAPIYHIPETNMYILSRYEDLNDVLKNVTVFSNDFGDMINGDQQASEETAAIYADGWPPMNTMLTVDPPAHKMYRSLVNKAFKNSRVAKMEGHIRSVVNQLLDRFIERGECDFVTEFCAHLPMWIIAEQLGVPVEDFEKFKRWSDAFASQLSQLATPEEQVDNAKNIVEFQHYFANKAEERRADPKDDIISDLANVELDEGRPLDTAELLSILQQLLVAGNETTAASIADGMTYLIKNPEQMARVKGDLSLVPNLVEEVLRLASPTQGIWRVVKEDTQLHGMAIPAGSMVMIRYAAANRDPRQFGENAESMDVTRENASDHYAFGLGIHFCVGAMLAKKEMVVAYEEVLKRMDNVQFLNPAEPLQYVPNALLRGLASLPIKFDKVS